MIEASVNSAELQAALRRAPDSIARFLRAGLRTMLRDFFSDFVRKSPVALTKRKGGLARRGRWPIRVTGRTVADMQASIGTKSGIAKVLQLGWTIKSPKKLLAIPLTKQFQTPSGAKSQGKKLFPRKVGSRVILFAKDGAKVVPLFVLLPEVKIPPQLRFYEEWDDTSAKAARMSKLAGSIGDALKETFGPEAVKEGV